VDEIMRTLSTFSVGAFIELLDDPDCVLLLDP
jgi:hypothetical protein